MTGSKEAVEQGIVALAVSPWMAGLFVRAWCSVQRPKAEALKPLRAYPKGGTAPASREVHRTRGVSVRYLYAWVLSRSESVA